MNQRRDFIKFPILAAAAVAWSVSSADAWAQAPEAADRRGKNLPPVNLLNASYDPTRELYVEYNRAFARYWLETTGQVVTVQQSHGGSGKQARAVIDGLAADVATLALGADIDAIQRSGNVIAKGWQERLPHNAAPYTSTIVMVVRQGNPKRIQDWDDLVRSDVKVITPNPKTSGGARWNYLAAWEYAVRKYGGATRDTRQAQAFITKLYANVPVLDTGARGASVTFAQRNQGDVLLAWENEAYLLQKEFPGKVQVVYPSMSILAQPSVALVDRTVDKKGTRAVAQAYLKYLYSDAAQEIIARHYYRPTSPQAKARYAKQFPALELFTIDQAFGGWDRATQLHFADGGTFDAIYVQK